MLSGTPSSHRMMGIVASSSRARHSINILAELRFQRGKGTAETVVKTADVLQCVEARGFAARPFRIPMQQRWEFDSLCREIRLITVW
jgi:hypothetical protein